MINDILKSMTIDEINQELNSIDKATSVILSKHEFLNSHHSLTEMHYNVYFNRMQAYEDRKNLLLQARSLYEKINHVVSNYNVNQQTASFIVNYFS